MAKEGEAPLADRPVADAVAEAPDDGLTADERGQFEQMRSDSSGPAPDPIADAAPDAGAAADGAADGAAAAAKPGEGAEADDDGDDDAPAAGAAPGADAGGKQPRRVSFSKYKRETDALAAKVAAAEGTIAQQQANQARLDERLKIINEALSTPAAEADGGKKAAPLPSAEDDPEPNAEEDVFGWIEWKKRDDRRFRADIAAGQERQQSEQAQATEVRNVNTAYVQDVQRFTAKEPHFNAAYQHLMASRVLELAEYFYGKDLTAEGAQLSPEEGQRISQTIMTEERGMVTAALKAGKSPSERLFRLAKARGFVPAAGAAPAANGVAAVGAKPNGAGAPGALDGDAGAGGGPSVKDEIARVKNGQDAALSLSGGGAAPAMTLDAKRLASMSDEDFGQMMDQMSPAEWKRVAGG